MCEHRSFSSGHGVPALADLLRNDLPHGKFWNEAWSLVEGCTPVSPGCDHCWLAGIYGRQLPTLPGGLVDSNGRFNGTVHCREDRLEIPLRKTKSKVFAIWSDFFHPAVPDDFRNRALAVMVEAAHHQFVIVTKRPTEAVRYFSDRRPLENVILLVTMEDQQRANERLNGTLRLAANGWRIGILAEPLLSGIDGWFLSVRRCVNGHIEPRPGCPYCPECGAKYDGSWLSWIITGGESGCKARPPHPDWFRSLRDQAQAAKIPFLFKQWGEWASVSEVAGPGRHFYFANGATVRRVGKRAAGRSLDGRELLGVPGR